MKHFLIALLGIMFLASGCSKEKSQEELIDTAYFIRFKAGGEVKEYREVVLAMQSTASGLHSVTVQGQPSLTGSSESILVGISEPEPVTVKTYSETANSESPAMVYHDTAGKEFSTLFATTETGMSVTVENITDKNIRGTFSGKAFDLNGNVVEITEGSFYAKFQ